MARLAEFRGQAAYTEDNVFIPEESTISAVFELLTSVGDVVQRRTVKDIRTWDGSPQILKNAVLNLVAILMQSPQLPPGVDVDQ